MEELRAQKRKALEAAYDYLGAPEAAAEWTSAVFRLVAAQDQAKAAARAFDDRAQEIAEAHDKYLYTELSHDAALKAAGYPEAKDWHIESVSEYGRTRYSCMERLQPLEEKVHRLVARQNEHIAKVHRLAADASS